ncbi:TIGR02281 family clan AA aspartic protease [Novosphingobium sp. BL-8A]|uniref:retropepsin-like aspartic protease family protein n=1 Tax=Novosphingobium sp. BL-8A TaxID=3127639 RepID=UPI0037573C6D
MRMGPIILVVVTVGLVALIAPGLKAGHDGDATTPTPPAHPQDAAARATWFAGSTEVARAPDGHFYADAEVEQHGTHFLVDTGATIVALTGSDARAIGLDWNDADLRLIGQGASGPVYGVPVTLSKIELGGLEARDVQAAIVPEGLDVSLLGQSFLSRMGSVRIEGDRMSIGGGAS